MMRYTLLLILSILSANVGWAYPSIKNSVNYYIDYSLSRGKTGAEAEIDANVSLNYDFSKLTLKPYVTSSKDNYPIQLGAFRIKSNAEALYKKVIEHIRNDAKIINEEDYYKVRITRFPDHYETGNYKTKELHSPVMTKSTDSVNNYTTIPISLVTPDNLQPATFLSYTMNATDKAATTVRNKGSNPWLKRINYSGKSLAFVNALIAAIVISIATMIILLVIILLNRRRMEKEERLHQYLLEKYQSLIINYLFGNASPEEFRSIASDTYRRQVLIDQMIDVSINLKGDESKKLQSLYKLLGLDRDSITKAYNNRWHKKIKGFRELAFMNIKDANAAIYKALNSSNEILRMEAQIALVRLSDDNPFEFLSHLTSHFSLWEQITLHDLIIQHNIPLPSFQKWLTSPNPTVVTFALRMIREFKQKESEDNVREILIHPNPSVRYLAVQVAGDLEMRSTLETMKHMYKNQEYNVCLEIIKSMGKMPDISMMGFLKLVLDKEDDVQLQIEATKAIEHIGEEGVKALVKLMASDYKNYNIIIKHVLDRRIF